MEAGDERCAESYSSTWKHLIGDGLDSKKGMEGT